MLKQICTLGKDDLSDPEIIIQKQEQIQKSLKKFKKYFESNYAKLLVQEEEEMGLTGKTTGASLKSREKTSRERSFGGDRDCS